MDPLISMFPSLRSLPSLSFNNTLLALFTVYLFTKVVVSKKSKGPLPPGPRGLPFLGNIFQIPQFQWLKYMEWQKEFGIPFSLSMCFVAEEFQVPSSHSTLPGTPSLCSIPMKLQPICWVSFSISHREGYHLLIVYIDRRSHTYSSRPRFIMAGEILAGGILIALCGYGELYAVLLFLVTT
jgi:hypothetical protein